MKPLSKIYPEMLAGDFPRDHPRANLFLRVRALLPDQAAVLDFGAGRGKFAEIDPVPLRRITDIRALTARYAAFDVDDAVLENLETTDRHMAPIGAPLPFEDNSFDLIFSSWVLEHIGDPEFYASEIQRILKPGGWFCALTPNRNGATGIGGRIVPNALHGLVLRFLDPERRDIDTFPTVYAMNTRKDISRLFAGCRNGSYTFSGPIAYHANRLPLMRIWQVIDWLTPPGMRRLLMVLVQKPETP